MTSIIPLVKPFFSTDEENAVKEVLRSGIVASGPKTKEFEEKFAEYIGVKYAIAVTNGTVALDVSLKLLNIGLGDEVVTSSFSFISSGNCILFQNAKPVFADIDPATFNIDPEDVAEKITSKTKAIIPIHIFGQPANMDALQEVCEDKNIHLVEDAAQAHGAEYHKRKIGSIGKIGCFSFYATKNMTSGEGGMITTNDKKLAEKARLLINHGQTQKYQHDILGYNYRMNDICSAVGIVQLKKIEEFNKKRIENANLLCKGIEKINGLSCPVTMENIKHVFHQYVIKIEENYHQERVELIKKLTKKGIGVAVHYPMPIYKQNLYQKLGYAENKCPKTEKICSKVLSIPVHPLVKKSDINYILENLKEK